MGGLLSVLGKKKYSDGYSGHIRLVFHYIRIENRLVGIVEVYTIIHLPDRVQIATKLEHFVGSPP